MDCYINKDTMQDTNVHALNPTSASLLGFLHERPMTGWEINEMADGRIGKFWSITKSQVYRELTALLSAGYIAAKEKGSRKKQPYIITDAGKAAFSKWIHTFDSPETIRIPMLLAVSFARFMEKGAVQKLLQDYLDVHSQQLYAYETTLDLLSSNGNDTDARRTLSFGIKYEKMTIEWIQETLESYEEGRP